MLNDELQTYARFTLKQRLALCTPGEQKVFKRMYADGNMTRDIGEVVDAMPAEKLSWAMEQVDRTIAKKAGGKTMKTVADRIAQLERNIEEGRQRYNRGEVSRDQWLRMQEDARQRIRELREKKGMPNG